VNKHEAKYTLLNCATLAAVLFTVLIANISSYIENLRLCSSAEVGIVLKTFINFEMNLVFHKIVLFKSVLCLYLLAHISRYDRLAQQK